MCECHCGVLLELISDVMCHVCVCMVWMVPMPVNVSCARSQDSSFSVWVRTVSYATAPHSAE